MGDTEYNIKTIIKSSVLILFSIIFYLTPFYINILSILFLPLTIAFLLISFYKYGFKLSGIIILIFTGILVYFMPIISFSFIFNSILPTLLLYKFFKKINYQNTLKIFYTAILFAVSISILSVFLLQVKKFNNTYQKEVDLQINRNFEIYIKYLKQKNYSETTIKNIIELKKTITNILLNYYPSVIFINYVIFLVLNVFIALLLISAIVEKKPYYIYFFLIKLKDHFIWLFIISWAIVFINLYLKIPTISFAFWNLSIIISFIYVIIGVAIFMLKLMIMKIPVLIKFIIMFILIQLYFRNLTFMIIGTFIFLGLGIFDVWFDFRGIEKIENMNNLL